MKVSLKKDIKISSCLEKVEFFKQFNIIDRLVA